MSTVAKSEEENIGEVNPTVLLAVISPSSYKADSLSLTIESICDAPSDINIRPRFQISSRWSACKDIIMDYCTNSNIHGLRYISEIHRPLYERLFWIIVLVISVYISGSLIWDTFVKWQDTPVILGFDETLVPVHEIPFPTITICPEIKIDINKFDFKNISKRLDEMQYSNGSGKFIQDEIDKFAAILHICKSKFVERFAPLITNYTRPDVAQTLADLSHKKNDSNVFCMWLGRDYKCDNVLNFVATDEGICYQFNGLQSKNIYRDPRFISYIDPQVVDFNNFNNDRLKTLENYTGSWSLDNGYIGQGSNSYPQRTVFSSAQKGFSITLLAYKIDLEQDYEHVCTCCTQGYKVYLNSPESVPLTQGGNYLLVRHGDEVMVSILPHYVTSTEDLRYFEPKKRQCYFNDERYLRYFQNYSQNNCLTECLSNFTISKCGCAKYWMPKPFDVAVCGVTDINCYSDARKEFPLFLHNQTMQESLDGNENFICNCMPTCNSLDYNFEISSARYDLPKYLKAYRFNLDQYLEFIGSRLCFYFKERQIIAVKRTVLFTVATLIASGGSICALFMGISILSIIEIVYFFSMSLFDSLHKRRIIKKKIMKENAGHEN